MLVIMFVCGVTVIGLKLVFIRYYVVHKNVWWFVYRLQCRNLQLFSVLIIFNGSRKARFLKFWCIIYYFLVLLKRMQTTCSMFTSLLWSYPYNFQPNFVLSEYCSRPTNFKLIVFRDVRNGFLYFGSELKNCRFDFVVKHAILSNLLQIAGHRIS